MEGGVTHLDLGQSCHRLSRCPDWSPPCSFLVNSGWGTRGGMIPPGGTVCAKKRLQSIKPSVVTLWQGPGRCPTKGLVTSPPSAKMPVTWSGPVLEESTMHSQSGHTKLLTWDAAQHVSMSTCHHQIWTVSVSICASAPLILCIFFHHMSYGKSKAKSLNSPKVTIISIRVHPIPAWKEGRCPFETSLPQLCLT